MNRSLSSQFSPRIAAWTIAEIVKLNTKIRDFWQSGGWAPAGAANLLVRSRLDRQVSLSHCLSLWFTFAEPQSQIPATRPWQVVTVQKNPAGDESADGRLILAWANLGSLVEGTLKFFLCVYAHDYSALPATKGREKEAIDPDELKLEPLKQYFIKNVWLGQNRKRWGRFIDLVQRRRNAIHSYQDREIGTLREFYVAVKTYLVFLKSTDDSVPYPDAEQEPTS